MTVHFLFRNLNENITAEEEFIFDDSEDEEVIKTQCDLWGRDIMYENEIFSQYWNSRTDSWSSESRADLYYDNCEWIFLGDIDYDMMGEDWLDGEID